MELVVDFETKDPYIEEGLGSGWPFYKEGRLQVLCAAYKVDQQQEEVTEDMSLLLDLVSKASTIICHNVNYDVGLLHALGADYSEATIVDTIQLAKLNNNNLFDYSLDTLSKEFFNEGKTSDKLGAIAVELGLVKTKAQNPNTVAMRNTDLIYKHDPVTVQMYAKQDVALTRRLYDKLKSVDVDLKFYSDLNKAMIAARSEGVRVDLKRAHEVEQLLTEKMKELEYVIEDLAPGVNVNSSKQLAEYFTGQGVEFPSTEKGNPSITKEFLATCPHPIAQAINKFKKYEKAVRDFTEPVIRGGRDRVYPELKIFGAAATGRMSCANPNLQQIPKRDEEIGPLVRSIYLPEDGEKWYSLDFSSQEPRLQIHFASLLNAPKVDELVAAYKENPKYDLHKWTASLMFGVSESGVTKDQRNQAKTINLGLAYGMGVAKLAASMHIPVAHAQNLLNTYHVRVPFMKYLTTMCASAMRKRGYLKTLGGRLVKDDGFSHKAMNKLIQGSASDQTYACMVEMYRRGIKFKFPIHDSIEISAKDAILIKEVKDIMENTVKLVVPSLTDVECGDTWGSLEKVSL